MCPLKIAYLAVSTQLADTNLHASRFCPAEFSSLGAVTRLYLTPHHPYALLVPCPLCTSTLRCFQSTFWSPCVLQSLCLMPTSQNQGKVGRLRYSALGLKVLSGGQGRPIRDSRLTAFPSTTISCLHPLATPLSQPLPFTKGGLVQI